MIYLKIFTFLQINFANYEYIICQYIKTQYRNIQYTSKICSEHRSDTDFRKIWAEREMTASSSALCVYIAFTSPARLADHKRVDEQLISKSARA